jgi:Glycosyl hydrolases family 39
LHKLLYNWGEPEKISKNHEAGGMMLIPVNFNLGGKSYTPYWRVCIGGGRVGEALRADFQRHLELVQREMPFQYIGMHGLFHEI